MVPITVYRNSIIVLIADAITGQNSESLLNLLTEEKLRKFLRDFWNIEVMALTGKNSRNILWTLSPYTLENAS